MVHPRFAALALALGLLFTPSIASATTVLQVDVETMTETSDWVVRASVASVQAVDLRAEGQGIFTDVTLTVREVYRGEQVPATYVLRLLGGRGVDGTSLWIPGMPKFQQGEDVVLFLEKTLTGHIPCGLGQGVWRVAPGAQGALWVDQSVGGAHLMRRGADGRLSEAPERVHSGARLLNELVAEVYSVLLR